MHTVEWRKKSGFSNKKKTTTKLQKSETGNEQRFDTKLYIYTCIWDAIKMRKLQTTTLRLSDEHP